MDNKRQRPITFIKENSIWLVGIQITQNLGNTVNITVKILSNVIKEAKKVTITARFQIPIIQWKLQGIL
jgi:hypothetical protein